MITRPKKIFHIGDVHVFFSKKFEAHDYVFQEFYKEIENEKPELIVAVGDLLDSKTKLSPEQFLLARTFLLNIASYCPVIIILGNHDLNLQNKDRLDSISPIVQSLENQTKNPIHYLKHSGIYDLYDIKWAVWSCLDDQQAPEISRTDSDYIVGLYHGSVKGCVGDNGFVLSEGIDVDEFKDCNIVMMADIHAQSGFRPETVEIEIEEEELQKYLDEGWEIA
jgi:predicted phosphodiesterase